MAKPEPWRLALNRYPFIMTVPTRYQDLDIMGHVNNVAMAGMFETGRIHFHRHLGHHPQEAGVRWLIAAVDLNYLHEAHFPDEMTIGCAIGHIGNTSWQVMSVAFQNDICVATCDSIIVTNGPEGRRKVDDALRRTMDAKMIRRDQV